MSEEKKKTFFSSFLLILFCLLWVGGKGSEVDFWYFVLKEGIFQKWKFYSLGEGCLWSCNWSMQWWNDKQNAAPPILYLLLPTIPTACTHRARLTLPANYIMLICLLTLTPAGAFSTQSSSQIYIVSGRPCTPPGLTELSTPPPHSLLCFQLGMRVSIFRRQQWWQFCRLRPMQERAQALSCTSLQNTLFILGDLSSGKTCFLRKYIAA